MTNVSINQLKAEILTAKKQALKDPYQYERYDNGLSDMITQRLNISGTRSFPSDVRKHVDQIFDKFPDQLKVLGLYYDAGFTTDEIADMGGSSPQNVKKSLTRAKTRLKKYLTPTEYDSIRWAIGDHAVLNATQPRFVNPFYNDFVEPQPCYTVGDFDPALDPINREIQGLHPDPKVLPTPRWILLGLEDAVS